MTLYPTLPPAPSETPTLPLFCDIRWDEATDEPIFGPDGEPELCYGLEALKGWMKNAIRTARFEFEIYAADYGCELNRLLGQPYRRETKLAEAQRYLREALEWNPYIKSVTVTEVSFEGTCFTANIRAQTVYGEVKDHV